MRCVEKGYIKQSEFSVPFENVQGIAIISEYARETEQKITEKRRAKFEKNNMALRAKIRNEYNVNTEMQTTAANLFKARFPYVYINTWEEQRAENLISDIAANEGYIKTKRFVYVWTQTDGLICKEKKFSNKECAAPIKAFKFVEDCKDDAIFIFKDLHVFFGVNNRPPDYAVIRKMRDIILNLRESANRKNVVLISPELVIPEDMQKEISVYDFPLPKVNEIMDTLNRMISENGLRTELSTEGKEKLAKAALGLTLQEADNAFSRAIVQNRGLNEDAIKVIFDEKNQVIKKTGILEFIKSDLNIDDIGGLENLKSWLKKRNNSWLDSARKYNIPAPKGVLITGIPGCGKSLTAKAMSAIWQLPLLKLDMGKIFSGIVGSSEQNMRRAIATAEAVAPSILWVDEIEKGLAGAGGSGDSGTTTRIFGTFLTWMQEKTAPVFVIATANDISTLPPELLRKGRFDEIFFVDLPTLAERKKIFEVHLRKRVLTSEAGQSLKIDDELLDHLSKLSEGFVGAEIEQAVISALYEAFFNQRDIIKEDLDTSITSTVPLSVTQKEQIKRLRDWADVRAVSATARDDRVAYEANSAEKESDVDTVRGGRMLDF